MGLVVTFRGTSNPVAVVRGDGSGSPPERGCVAFLISDVSAVVIDGDSAVVERGSRLAPLTFSTDVGEAILTAWAGLVRSGGTVRPG